MVPTVAATECWRKSKHLSCHGTTINLCLVPTWHVADDGYIWSAIDLLEQVKTFLIFVQFSLALGGLVALKETSPLYTRLVSSWWAATCGLSVFTLLYTCLRVYSGKELPLLDVCTSILMGGLATGYFLGYYGQPDPYGNRSDFNPCKSVEKKNPLETIREQDKPL